MPDVRNANGGRRRKLTRRVILSENTCGICGQPVDKSLDRLPGVHNPSCRNPACSGCKLHPLRAEVDEILPVSKGGSPIQRSNMRLTHRICNQRRGNRMGAVRTMPAPMTTERKWS